MVSAASLNTRVTIMRKTGAVDQLGQPSETWEVFMSVWGNVRHQTGLQSISAEKLGVGGKASIRIRQSSCSKTIAVGMRAVADGKTFKILDTPRQGREALDLVVQAV